MAINDTGKGRQMVPFPPILISIAKIVLTILVTMLGLIFITFIIGRIMPVDPVLSIVGERAAKDVYDAAYIKLGLDKPLLVQF